MSIEQMRNEVIKLYPGRGWQSRVLAMTDAQIFAIYNKSVNKGDRR